MEVELRFHRTMEHVQDCTVSDHPKGMTHIWRHCKDPGVQLPSLRSIIARDLYVEMADTMGNIG